MCGSTPKAPKPPPPPVMPPPPAQDVERAVSDNMDRERRRRLATQGQASTMLTGGAGVTGAAQTTGKSMLGG